jgi:hypothetical protein
VAEVPLQEAELFVEGFTDCGRCAGNGLERAVGNSNFHRTRRFDLFAFARCLAMRSIYAEASFAEANSSAAPIHRVLAPTIAAARVDAERVRLFRAASAGLRDPGPLVNIRPITSDDPKDS